MTTFRNKFHPGQVIRHKLFDYRGVVVSMDHTFQLPEEWYQEVARSRPPKDQPWYHVLVHGARHHLRGGAEPGARPQRAARRASVAGPLLRQVQRRLLQQLPRRELGPVDPRHRRRLEDGAETVHRRRVEAAIIR